jgi:hypothetical protein
MEASLPALQAAWLFIGAGLLLGMLIVYVRRGAGVR